MYDLDVKPVYEYHLDCAIVSQFDPDLPVWEGEIEVVAEDKGHAKRLARAEMADLIAYEHTLNPRRIVRKVVRVRE